MRRRRGEAPNWPKQLPVLSEEQEEIRADFYRLWLHELPRKYKPVDWFHHHYPAKRPPPEGGRTLEVGAGFGNQIQYEDLSRQHYAVIDMREEMVEKTKEAYPEVEAHVADASEHLPFPDDHFDRVLAVQVLEHIPNLPPALEEIRRVMKPAGRFIVVIPCEGGKAYDVARAISARPLFEKRYNSSYDWLVASEHCNVPWEIDYELRKRFEVRERTFFPLLVPSVNANLLIGLTVTPLP
jgi:SAM-dependent methyltransferase